MSAMTRKEALKIVSAAINRPGLDHDEYWAAEPFNGDCPQAVLLVRALEALGLLKLETS